MRQVHVAGEKLFVDFAGRTAEVIDPGTGEIIPVQIFVATLGASSFTYAEATWSQKLPDWIAAHVRAFACQIASNCDPLFASNRAPSPALAQACPGSEQEGPARSGVTAPSPTERSAGGACLPTGASRGDGQVRFLNRQLSLPVSMMSQWWVRRSSMAVVILASPNTWGQSAKVRLVVISSEVFS